MNLDEYLQSVDFLAHTVVDRGVAPHDYIQAPGNHAGRVADCITYRELLLTRRAFPKFESYGMPETAAFREWKAKDAIEWFHGIGRLARRRTISPATLCSAFSRKPRGDGGSRPSPFASICNMPPICWISAENVSHTTAHSRCSSAHRTFLIESRRGENGSPDLELIELDAVRSVAGSEIYRAGKGFSKLSAYLSPGIVNWAHNAFTGRPVYIRLDPHHFYDAQPLHLLSEATLVPANPRWLPGFTLRKGMKEFAAYQLLDRPPAEAPAEFWDYRVRHMRRLEVHVLRRREDYLSMMIEELPREDDPNGFMVARCIHLDTRDPAGTLLGEVELQHLDLALNVYCGSDRAARFSQSLPQGKVQDATIRTHLFRIERAPFVSLFSFCEMFLRSRVLLSEWLNELFGSA